MTRPGGMHGHGPLVVMMLAAATVPAACGPAQFPGREGFTDGGSESIGSETGVPDLPFETETGDSECPELINTGNVSLASYDELALLDGVTMIDGDLELTGTFGELPEDGLDALRCLEEVTGFVYVHDTDLVDFTGLDALRRIGGYLYIGQTFNLQTLDGLGALRQIGSYLHLSENFSLSSTAGTDLLVDVGDFIVIHNNPLLQDLSGLSGLPGTNGQLRIEANPSLTSLAGLDNLRGIGGDLGIVDNFALVDTSALGGIERVGGNVFFQGSPNLWAMELWSLQTINGYLFIVDMPGMLALDDLFSLYGINNSLYLWNTGLNNVDGLASLEYLGGDVWIQDNANLTNVDGLSSLETAYGIVRIDLNPALLDVRGLENLQTVADGLSLWGNYALSDMSLASLQSVGDWMRIGYSSLADIPSIPISTVGGDLLIHNNAQLTTVASFPNLQSVGGHLYLRENPELTSVSFPALTQVFGRVQMIDNDKMTNLDGLSSIALAQAVNIRENAWLNDISGLDNLTEVPGMFKIVLNGGLVNLDGLDNLQSVGGDFEIRTNGNLVTIPGLSALEAVGGNVIISENDDLPTCLAQQFVNGISFVGGSIDVSANLADGCGG